MDTSVSEYSWENLYLQNHESNSSQTWDCKKHLINKLETLWGVRQTNTTQLNITYLQSIQGIVGRMQAWSPALWRYRQSASENFKVSHSLSTSWPSPQLLGLQTCATMPNLKRIISTKQTKLAERCKQTGHGAFPATVDYNLNTHFFSSLKLSSTEKS